MPKNDPGCGQMARAAKKMTRSFQPRKKFLFKQTQLATSQLILQAGSRASLGRDLPWGQWEGRAGDISECELGAPTAPPAAARGPGGAAANILFLMVSSAQEIQGLPHPRQLGAHGVPVPHQSSCKSTLEVLIFEIHWSSISEIFERHNGVTATAPNDSPAPNHSSAPSQGTHTPLGSLPAPRDALAAHTGADSGSWVERERTLLSLPLKTFVTV